MDAVFVEMKDVEDLRGSINAKVSLANRMKRPVALSESFAYTDENISRCRTTQNELRNTVPIQESPESQERQENQESHVNQSSPDSQGILTVNNEQLLYTLNTIMRFLFHIVLISIFESLFFFIYVSTLEDSGIEKTVGGFINGAVNSCKNITAPEAVVITDILSLFVNSTQTIQQGNIAFQHRQVINSKLFIRAWIYVGCFSAIFILISVCVLYKKVKIQWKTMFLENIGMVLVLAAYEYMFFSTIIFPYQPISGDEISRNAIEDLQQSCGLFQ